MPGSAIRPARSRSGGMRRVRPPRLRRRSGSSPAAVAGGDPADRPRAQDALRQARTRSSRARGAARRPGAGRRPRARGCRRAGCAAGAPRRAIAPSSSSARGRRRAGDLDQRPAGGRAELVDVAREQAAPGAGLAADQQRDATPAAGRGRAAARGARGRRSQRAKRLAQGVPRRPLREGQRLGLGARGGLADGSPERARLGRIGEERGGQAVEEAPGRARAARASPSRIQRAAAAAGAPPGARTRARPRGRPRARAAPRRAAPRRVEDRFAGSAQHRVARRGGQPGQGGAERRLAMNDPERGHLADLSRAHARAARRGAYASDYRRRQSVCQRHRSGSAGAASLASARLDARTRVAAGSQQRPAGPGSPADPAHLGKHFHRFPGCGRVNSVRPPSAVTATPGARSARGLRLTEGRRAGMNLDGGGPVCQSRSGGCMTVVDRGLEVRLRNWFDRPYDDAISAARTCYSPRVIDARRGHRRPAPPDRPADLRRRSPYGVPARDLRVRAVGDLAPARLVLPARLSRSTTPSSRASATCASTRWRPTFRRRSAGEARAVYEAAIERALARLRASSPRGSRP